MYLCFVKLFKCVVKRRPQFGCTGFRWELCAGNQSPQGVDWGGELEMGRSGESMFHASSFVDGLACQIHWTVHHGDLSGASVFAERWLR